MLLFERFLIRVRQILLILRQTLEIAQNKLFQLLKRLFFRGESLWLGFHKLKRLQICGTSHLFPIIFTLFEKLPNADILREMNLFETDVDSEGGDEPDKGVPELDPEIGFVDYRKTEGKRVGVF